MPAACSYFMCYTKKSQKPMFRFPVTNPKRLQVWLDNCGNMTLSHCPPEKLHNKFLCVDHFDKNLVGKFGNRIILDPSAVPEPYRWEESPPSPPQVPEAEIYSEGSTSSTLPGRGSPELRVLAPKKVYAPTRKQNGDEKEENIRHIKGDTDNHNVKEHKIKEGRQKSSRSKKGSLPRKSQCKIDTEKPRRRGRKNIKRKHSETMEGSPFEPPAKSIGLDILGAGNLHTNIPVQCEFNADNEHLVAVKAEPIEDERSVQFKCDSRKDVYTDGSSFNADNGHLVTVKAEPIDNEIPIQYECEFDADNEQSVSVKAEPIDDEGPVQYKSDSRKDVSTDGSSFNADNGHLVTVKAEPIDNEIPVQYDCEFNAGNTHTVAVKAEPIEEEITVQCEFNADNEHLAEKADPIDDEPPSETIVKQELIEVHEHPPETELRNYKALYIKMKQEMAMLEVSMEKEMTSLKAKNKRLIEQNQSLRAKSRSQTRRIDELLQTNIEQLIKGDKEKKGVKYLEHSNQTLKVQNLRLTRDIKELRTENREQRRKIQELTQQQRGKRRRRDEPTGLGDDAKQTNSELTEDAKL